MQYVTEQYRQEMKLPFRGASSTYVYIGLINNDAQRNAHITSSYSGDESHLYDNSEMTTGVTSTESNGSITFTFGDFYELNIAGLQITFIGTPPSSISVTNGTKTKSYVTGGTNPFTFDDGYTNCHYLKITPNSGKLKISSITFGIGLQFSNKQLINTTRSNTVNHISNDLPSKQFSFTIDNRLHMFNKDNPYGYADYIQEQQEVTFEYGRELSDGSVYKIKGGKVLLKTWSSDDYEAKFSCVGYLDYLNGQYYKGQYSKEGVPASTVARNVFADAGITNYVLDPTLDSILINNPVPVCSYKEAIQMIANACRCTLYEDRDGNICIINANKPSFIGEVKFTGATDYSIPSSLFESNANIYADAEYDYAVVDNSMIFLPEDNSYVDVGFVSSEIADSNGAFSNNPSIDVKFKSEYHVRQIFLCFAKIAPTSLTITVYHNGQALDSATFSTPTITTTYVYDGVIDSFKIVFNSAQPNQRIHLNSIELNGYIDYELTYHELKNTPIANSLEKTSNVNVHYYTFSNEKYQEGYGKSSTTKTVSEMNEDGGYTDTVVTETSEYGASVVTVDAFVGTNTVILNQPYYDYMVDGGTIKESGAYYLVVESDGKQDVAVYAKPFSVTDNLLTVKVHEKGDERESKNALIGNLAMASTEGAWLKDFYDDDLEYDLTYRGDPILDCDDLLFLENHFVDLNQIRIVEETISTTMGIDFSCRLTGRRTWFQTTAQTGMAVVGRIIMGETIN